ncbi:MAG: glycosyltransferase family 2 protein [Rhodospirillales bacterium]
MGWYVISGWKKNTSAALVAAGILFIVRTMAASNAQPTSQSAGPAAGPERPELPAPELSVVVPVLNEAGNIAPLIGEIRAALDGRMAYQIVYVDDGSGDGTARELLEAAGQCPFLKVVRHNRRLGQSAALITGLKAALAPLVATLDGDGQNDPADIVKLLARRLEAPAPDREKLMIAGHRANRKDTWGKRASSVLANRVRGAVLGDRTPDTGCGLKLFPRAAFMEMPHFDHMHRFLPALMIRSGGRVVSVVVNHRPRRRGRSNYGMWDRLWVGIVDLFGVMWLLRRACAPLVDNPDDRPDDKHD